MTAPLEMSRCAPHQVAEEAPAPRAGGLEADPQGKPVETELFGVRDFKLALPQSKKHNRN